MPTFDAERTLRELDTHGFIRLADENALLSTLAADSVPDTSTEDPGRLPRLGFLYETIGLARFSRSSTGESGSSVPESLASFYEAFRCWRALAASSPIDKETDRACEAPAAGSALFESEMGEGLASAETALAFHLAVTGILAGRSAETRLELQRFDISRNTAANDWRERVAETVLRALVLLVRKASGWTDIDLALSLIEDLRAVQDGVEGDYLRSVDSNLGQAAAAAELVGLYHMVQSSHLVANHLKTGEESLSQISTRLERHRDRAREAFVAACRPKAAHLASMFWAGCVELVRNSIWTHIGGLGKDVRRFAQILTSAGRPRPAIELWPSQQEAFRKGLLDPYPRAVLVEMPTSSGKTLLAKFAIVQTRALNPQGSVAYVVPTRALVNQVTMDLRTDFREMGIRVEQAVPAFEMDPTEDKLLRGRPDVLVTTPEKLDLLIRQAHPATQEMALVIADEAHNIRDGERGARLELLLGTIKRDCANVRFLLLSPFLPNDEELVRWLGDERYLAPICVDWKPGRRVVGALEFHSRRKVCVLQFRTLPAADNTDVRDDVRIPVWRATASACIATSVSGITRAATDSLRGRGGILVLCRGRGTAVTRSLELAETRPERQLTAEASAVCHYLESEMGQDSALPKCIRKGVAYHHAGMSSEARWLVEWLIGLGFVDVVCGTTTLAQGVNFPISTVIVETLQKGDSELSYQDFWNIAGRAGRTLMDPVGIVAFPAPDASRLNEFKGFLRGEAEEISSQLAALLPQADDIARKFSLTALKSWPQLSALLQFLAHAMRVSDKGSIADEVEDVLRASLVYHQAKRLGPDASRKLLALCRAYVEDVKGKRGLVAMADGTGFATPSVSALLAATKGDPELSSVDNWQPHRLFGEDAGPLSARVRAVAELPEVKLGQGSHPPFNADRVAAILQDWVRGADLQGMAKKHWLGDEDADPTKRVEEFSKYLFSQLIGTASWGIGALERVCLAGTDQTQVKDAAYISSMIFYGAASKEAVWLRMVGVPRFAADNLGHLWDSQRKGEPESYDDIRSWVSRVSDENWQRAIPTGSHMTPTEMRLIWRHLSGFQQQERGGA